MLHLTDQYFVSHTAYNCTDIFQRGRIQGKYTDNPNLIFWTTKELVEIINNYVDFITKIEGKSMSLPRGHEYIRNLCEINLFHKEFIKTLGRQRQRKNLESKCIKYDRKNNAMVYSFPPNLKPENYKKYFSNWCKEQNIEFNGFINKLVILDKNEFINKYGDYEIKQFFEELKPDFENYADINERLKLKELNPITDKWYNKRKSIKDGNIWRDIIRSDTKKFTKKELEKEKYEGIDRKNINSYRYNLCYDSNQLLFSIRHCQNDANINDNFYIEHKNKYILPDIYMLNYYRTEDFKYIGEQLQITQK